MGVQRKFVESYCRVSWKNEFDLADSNPLIRMCTFIFKKLEDNRYKVFKWKLYNKIIPSKVMLCKWKIEENNMCNVCNIVEDYEHYFIGCTYFDAFWQKIIDSLKEMYYMINIKRLQYIVMGYKIVYTNYEGINVLLTIIGYAIYKTFHVSEQKRKYVNAVSILRREIEQYITYTRKFQVKLFLEKFIGNM